MLPTFTFLLLLVSAFIYLIFAHPHGHINRKHAFVSNKQPSLPTYHENIESWTFLDTEPDITLNDVLTEEANNAYDVVYDLINRVFGSNSHFTSQFILELIDSQSAEKYSNKFLSNENIEKYNLDKHPFWLHSLKLDVLELDNNGTNGIILRGSSTLAIIGAFKWYLQEWCNTTYDWRTYTLDLPAHLPLPSSERRQRSVPFSYYENVCTVSYSQAFWTWTQWEPHLDWMAMQGINIPLAFTGQEYVWSKTFAQFGFNQEDLQAFFSGPGFFAWQRMGNLRGWGGPITQSMIMDQYYLQLKILSRMNSFGMIPVLTAFAGHVPYAITDYYPTANVDPSPNWWGSPSEWCCNLLLNYTDSLFVQIGSAFIVQQTKYFGSGHIYQCDSFNEMNPPTNNVSYLNSSSASIYQAMHMEDEHAVWLMQGWLFEGHAFWQPTQVKAYLDGVPDDGLMILDLYSEISPQYTYFESFYGHPFIWNTLHNFGGNHGLLGTLHNIGVGLPNAFVFPNTTVMGVGITMEGINQNYIIYDLTLSMAYETTDVDMNVFVDKYALRRYGLPHSAVDTSDMPWDDSAMSVADTMIKAWQILHSTVYNISHWGGVTKNLMCIVPSLKAIHSGFMPTQILYDPIVIQEVWQLFLSVSNNVLLANVEKYRYDLIDITRQSLSDVFLTNYVLFNSSYYNKNMNDVKKYGSILMELMTDLDAVLNTNENWMLGQWIAMAKNHSNGTSSVNETILWEFNARNQVSLWGPDGEISNYASKQWGGLIGDYHQPQWQLFIDEVTQAVENNSIFSESGFTSKNMNNIEQPWQISTEIYPTNALNDTIIVACELFRKWNTLNDSATCATN